MYSWSNRLSEPLRRLEHCILGVTDCPRLPLIITSWGYAYTGLEGYTSGEEIWMGSVVSAKSIKLTPATSRANGRVCCDSCLWRSRISDRQRIIRVTVGGFNISAD